MRKDVVVLTMVFIAGLLLGVVLTGGVMGTMMWMKAEHYQMELMEAQDIARMQAEKARMEAQRALEVLEEQKRQEEAARDKAP